MAEDSSWEGWTSPLGPPGMMDYPSGRKLDSPPRKGYQGSIRSGVEADDDTIRYAAQYWPQRELKDFQIEHRVWRDCATQEEFRLCPGNALLSVGLDGDSSAADCFIVAGGQLWFLRRADRPEGRSIEVGSMGVTS